MYEKKKVGSSVRPSWDRLVLPYWWWCFFFKKIYGDVYDYNIYIYIYYS